MNGAITVLTRAAQNQSNRPLWDRIGLYSGMQQRPQTKREKIIGGNGNRLEKNWLKLQRISSSGAEMFMRKGTESVLKPIISPLCAYPSCFVYPFAV